MNFIVLDPKPQFSLGLDLTPNFVCLHPLIEGYDSLVMYEHWVDLGNMIFVRGTHLGFFVSFLDPKHNSAIWVSLDSY